MATLAGRDEPKADDRGAKRHLIICGVRHRQQLAEDLLGAARSPAMTSAVPSVAMYQTSIEILSRFSHSGDGFPERADGGFWITSEYLENPMRP